MENKNIDSEEVVIEKETAHRRGMATSEAKPSLDPVESLFSEAWKLYQERFVPLTRIVLLPVLVLILGYTLSSLHLPFSSILGDVVLLVGWLMSLFNILPIAFSLHNKTDVDDSYKATMRWVLPFAWLMILELCAVAFGFVMLIVPSIWLAFAFSFVSYVFVIEGTRGLAALQRSSRYIEGYWFAVVGRVILMGIFATMAAAMVQWLVVPILGNTAAAIASIVLTLFTTPFTAVYCYCLYKNLQTLKLGNTELHISKGGRFIKVSVIVGAVVLAIVILAAIFFAWHGVARSFELGRWMSHQ